MTVGKQVGLDEAEISRIAVDGPATGLDEEGNLLCRVADEISRDVRLSNEAKAESLFRRALELAQRQEAKSLELRAVMSLGRLWQQQDKQAEARQLLSENYNWFTEGFDTKDLQDAKALLEELA